MLFRVPVPGVAEIIVLTEKTDTFDIVCNRKPDAQVTLHLAAGNIYSVQCSIVKQNFIVYLADFSEDTPIDDFIETIRKLRLVIIDLTARTTVFIPR